MSVFSEAGRTGCFSGKEQGPGANCCFQPGFISWCCSEALWLILGGRGVCGGPDGQEAMGSPTQLGGMEQGCTVPNS